MFRLHGKKCFKWFALLYLVFVATYVEADILDTSYDLLNNDPTLRIIYGGEIKLLDKKVSDLNLAALNSYQLKLLRNTIFAKCGYSFKSENLKLHFKRFNWYKPGSSNVNNLLSDVDKDNIARIQTFEKGYASEGHKVTVEEKKLIGMWHSMSSMAAGWAERISFFEDKTFRYKISQFQGDSRLRDMEGEWTLDRNRLILEVLKRTVVKGGKLVPDPSAFFAIEGGKITEEAVYPPLILNFPISSDVKEVEVPPWMEAVLSYNIGNTQFWRWYRDPERIFED